MNYYMQILFYVCKDRENYRAMQYLKKRVLKEDKAQRFIKLNDKDVQEEERRTLGNAFCERLANVVERLLHP